MVIDDSCVVLEILIAHTDFGEPRIQDVGKMPWTIHPALHNFFRRQLPRGDVFTYCLVVVAFNQRPLPRHQSVLPGVTEEVLFSHVYGLQLRCGLQGGVGRQSMQPIGGANVVC